MGFAQTAAASMQLHDRLHNKLFIFVDRLTTKYHMIVYMGGSKCLQNTAMGHGHKLLTLLKISSLTKMSVNTHAYIYMASISASSKSPGIAKHTIGCAARWQYVCRKFQQEL